MSRRNYERGYISRSGSESYEDRGDFYGASYYYYGSAAPQLYDDPAAGETFDRRGRGDPEDTGDSRKARRTDASARPKRRSRMNPAMILGMAAALCAMCVMLFGYIRLEAQVTSTVEEIASMESELSDLRSDNDEALNEINAGISLDEIKYRAIAELGMSYAQEDQIITYSNEDSDYVRQLITPD